VTKTEAIIENSTAISGPTKKLKTKTTKAALPTIQPTRGK
jgi:hypothetical protein